MNIRDTLSHGNTPMCQVWHANVKAKKSHGPDTNLHEQMDGWTDRQTECIDEQTNTKKTQPSTGSNYTNKCNKESRSMQENKKYIGFVESYVV